MKKENKNLKFYGILILISVGFIVTPIIFRVFEIEILPSQFVGALFGVFITAIVTAFLLRGQTEGEAKKEIDTKKFEEKLKTYQKFLEKLCEIVKQDGSVSEKDIKDLIFQISLVRMHTKGKQVKGLFEAISKIISNINSKQLVESDKNDEADSIAELAKHILSVIEILQEELYTKEEIGELNTEDIKEIENSIKNLSEDIVGRMENKVDFDVIPQDKLKDINVEDVTKRFEKALEEKLQISLKEIKNLEYMRKGEKSPNFFIKNPKDWGDEFHVHLTYGEKLLLCIKGANENDYRALYLSFRRQLGGYFNRVHWYLPIEEPYTKWIFTDEGRELYCNLDEKMLSYICELITKSVKCFDDYRKIITLRDKLNSINPNIDKEGRKIWIWENKALVHDYTINLDGKRIITIDTTIVGDKWQITLFVRNENPENVKRILPKVFETFAEIGKTQGECRPILNSYSINEDLSETANFLMKLREMIEKELGF